MQSPVRLILICVISLFSFAHAVERGNVPRGIYLENELKEAQVEASERDKPLTFIFSQRSMRPV